MSEIKRNSGTGDENTVRITLRTIGPSPPSTMDVHSPIKVRDLRTLIAGNGRLPLENLKLVMQGKVLHDSKYGEDISVSFNNGDTLIVAVKPKPPAKHIQNGIEDDEEELKFQVPEFNSRWKRRLFIILSDKLKIPNMLLMAIFSLSLKAWAMIIMWFILAPIAHKWDVGPLYRKFSLSDPISGEFLQHRRRPILTVCMRSSSNGGEIPPEPPKPPDFTKKAAAKAPGVQDLMTPPSNLEDRNITEVDNGVDPVSTTIIAPESCVYSIVSSSKSSPTQTKSATARFSGKISSGTKIKSPSVFRKPKFTKRYNPMLSDFKVKEFVQDASHSSACEEARKLLTAKHTPVVSSSPADVNHLAQNIVMVDVVVTDSGDDAPVQNSPMVPKIPSYADKIRTSNEDMDLKLDFIDPVVTTEGKSRAGMSTEDLKSSSKVYNLNLFGFFLGTSMDFLAVRATLKRLWKHYDLIDVAKSPTGYFHFKFKNEQGLNGVLQNGPWMVKSIPIFLHKWEPGLCLQKIEPNVIPLWVSIHDVPLELWTSRGISKMASVIGVPKLMDPTTQERCKYQTGRVGFVRVLIDVPASGNLPEEIEVEYPPFNGNPGRVIKLGITYQWKPPVCSFCKVFGHSSKLCKSNPIKEATENQSPTTIVSLAAKASQPQPLIGTSMSPTVADKDGFVTVTYKRKRNKKKVQWQPKGKEKKESVVQPNDTQKINAVASTSSQSPKGKAQVHSNHLVPKENITAKIKNTPIAVPASVAPTPVKQKSVTKPKIVSGFNFAKAVQGVGTKSCKQDEGVDHRPVQKISSMVYSGPAQSKITTNNMFDMIGEDDDDGYDYYGSDSDEVYDPMNETSKFMEATLDFERKNANLGF